MNFRTYSDEELIGYLQGTSSQKDFINAAKEAIQRLAADDRYTEDQLDARIEEAKDEGYTEARKLCREEMAEFVSTTIGQQFNGELYDKLMDTARTIG